MRASKFVVSGILIIAACAAMAADLRTDRKADFKRPSHILFPDGAPYSPQIAALGKMLFFDPRLSGSMNMSCSSCHNPSFGWEVPTELAVGAMNVKLDRHTPTIENLAEARRFFWDGRARSLEEQARGPITHPLEMNASMLSVVSRIASIASYRQAFEIAFPDQGLSASNLLRAIATYERTLQSGRAPFDEWLDGDDDAISDAAKRGFDLFVGKATCVSCHTGWAMTDHDFHDIGMQTDDGGRASDEDIAAGRIAFKTSGLRNIGLRAPYMHDGGMTSLAEVVDHYNRGGVARQGAQSEIAPLHLSEAEVGDLLTFLDTLTSHDPPVSQPALPVQ